MMKRLYFNALHKDVQQINKIKARRLYEAGETIWLLSSNLRLNNLWQAPMDANKAFVTFNGYTFDEVCGSYAAFNCDNKRGKYIHFYVEADKITPRH